MDRDGVAWWRTRSLVDRTHWKMHTFYGNVYSPALLELLHKFEDGFANLGSLLNLSLSLYLG